MWNNSLAVNSVNLVNITAYNSTYIEFFLGDYFFLRALYAQRSMCYRQSVRLRVLVSACLPSVTRVDRSKTVEVRIMKFSPHSSPIPLFWLVKFPPEILTGYTHERGYLMTRWSR